MDFRLPLSVPGFLNTVNLMSNTVDSLWFWIKFVLLSFSLLGIGFFLRPRKIFGDFPVVGKYEDLLGGLVSGTEIVSIPIV